LVIGNSTGGTVASYVCQQFKVQRYLSCKSLKEAQKCIYIAAVGILFICLMGKFILISQLRIYFYVIYWYKLRLLKGK